MILPYVYKLTHKETGQFYFGSRWANKVSSSMDLGIKYFTSSKYVKPIFNQFNCEIIAEFFNKTDAYIFEQQLIKENWESPLKLNKKYHLGTDKLWMFTSGITKGIPKSEEWKQKNRKPKIKPKTKEQIEKWKISYKTYLNDGKPKLKPFNKGIEIITPIGSFISFNHCSRYFKGFNVKISLKHYLIDNAEINKYLLQRNKKFCLIFNITQEDIGKHFSDIGFKILPKN